jgi:L-alanine-DL-glutamate epimerase-like enolase superfamily enzyme
MPKMRATPDGRRRGVKTELKRLMLRHTWTTTMSSSAYRDTVHVQYKRDGITGYGEGAPIVRYKEYPEQAKQAIDAIIEPDCRWRPTEVRQVSCRVCATRWATISMRPWPRWTSRSATGWARNSAFRLYQYFGLDPADAPVTTFSIGIDTPEITRQKTREAEEFPVLKVKVGLKNDEETIEAVRSVTKKPLRVDANEGWTDKEEAIRKINWLETQGVELIEQPMPAHMFEETKYVRGKVHIPVIADEACTHASMIPALKEAYDGINVKLDKSGGMMEAYRWIKFARAMNMKVMLGCMVSSSCTVTAAAHLAALVDYSDLDGNLLISNDPYEGVKVLQGKLILPAGPGLGLKVLAL